VGLDRFLEIIWQEFPIRDCAWPIVTRGPAGPPDLQTPRNQRSLCGPRLRLDAIHSLFGQALGVGDKGVACGQHVEQLLARLSLTELGRDAGHAFMTPPEPLNLEPCGLGLSDLMGGVFRIRRGLD
jgi:hypothetical protein